MRIKPYALPASFALLAFFATPALLAQRGAAAGRAPAPTGVTISPDAQSLAWTLGGRGGASLHVSPASNPDPAKDQIIAPNGATSCSNSAPVWSPDSQWLAFTSTCTSKEEKPGQEQIFLWSKASGEVKQLTHVTGLFKQAAWSPDGKTIAFLFVENASRSAGALDAMKPWAGVIGEDNLEIQGVYGVNIATGSGSWLVAPSPGMYTFEFNWAPDSKKVVFVGANAPGENNWWVAKLYSVSIFRETIGGAPGDDVIIHNTHLKTDLILDPVAISGPLYGLQIALPRFSPDGKHIAFIGGLMSDFGSTGGDVWVISTDVKGDPVDVTPAIDGTPTYIAWTGNDSIGMVEDRRGHNVLAAYDINTRKQADAVDMGEVQLSGGPFKNAISVSTYGMLAFIKSGIGMTPEVWAGPWRKFQQFSHFGNSAPTSSARIESIEWENEGFHVQGWLTYPTGYDSHKKYPLIVTVHGGPSASAFPRGAGQWADLGYFEFQPNPRGSFGQGEAFVQANRKDFGYGDLRDILKGMDAVEAKVSIDKKREGLTGWSYGGFMSMFAETQTNRFAAIVAGAGISDWLSYYGENSIDQWMVPFFGASVYDDPKAYEKSSAITYIKNSKTPMLIIVGDRDGECPAPQSFEMWHALRAIGVKTQLVVYPNEGHGFRDPEHIRDRNERTQKWFAENMPGR